MVSCLPSSSVVHPTEENENENENENEKEKENEKENEKESKTICFVAICRRLEVNVFNPAFDFDDAFEKGAKLKFAMKLMGYGLVGPLGRGFFHYKVRLVFGCILVLASIVMWSSVFMDWGSENTVFQMIFTSWMSAMAIVYLLFLKIMGKTEKNNFFYQSMKLCAKTEKQFHKMETFVYRTSILAFAMALGNGCMLLLAGSLTSVPERLGPLTRWNKYIFHVFVLFAGFPASSVWVFTMVMLVIPGYCFNLRYQHLVSEITKIVAFNSDVENIEKFVSIILEFFNELNKEIRLISRLNSTLSIIAFVGYGIPIILLLFEMLHFDSNDPLALMELFWLSCQLMYVLGLCIPAAYANGVAGTIVPLFAQMLKNPLSRPTNERNLLVIVESQVRNTTELFKLGNWIEVTFPLIIRGFSGMLSLIFVFQKLQN